jgi:hypothetical protein
LTSLMTCSIGQTGRLWYMIHDTKPCPLHQAFQLSCYDSGILSKVDEL